MRGLYNKLIGNMWLKMQLLKCYLIYYEIVDEVNIKPPPPKEKLNSKIQRLKFFNINISGEILELLNVSITEKDNTKKKELGYNVVKKSGYFIKSLFKK